MRKRNTNTPLTYIFMKTHNVQQTKHQLRHNISEHVKLQGISWDLSMMRQSYKLTITTKTEKIENSLKC